MIHIDSYIISYISINTQIFIQTWAFAMDPPGGFGQEGCGNFHPYVSWRWIIGMCLSNGYGENG